MPESNDTPDGWSEAAAAKQSEALQGLRSRSTPWTANCWPCSTAVPP